MYLMTPWVITHISKPFVPICGAVTRPWVIATYYAVSPSGECESSQFRYISVAHFRRDIIWWWCQRLTFTHIITWPKLRSLFLIHQPSCCLTLTFDPVSHHPHQQTLCPLSVVYDAVRWAWVTTVSLHQRRPLPPRYHMMMMSAFNLYPHHHMTETTQYFFDTSVWRWIIENQLFTYGTVTQPCVITLTTQFHYHLLVPGPLSSRQAA